MTFSQRFSRSLASCLIPLLVLPAAIPAPAQTPRKPAQQASAGWLYKNSDVPPDTEWNFGELANGLRYATRKNGVPPGQVSIRIRVDAGSLNEQESEQGFAHLLEHLLFRQSKYLGNGEAIPTWQRLGASFGNDTNAETTPTQTVYKLDLPNATPASLEESFKLLSGMVTAPTLSEANIRTEVPIVLAEMRERGGAGQRVQEATRRTFYAGQPLATRAPIGTVATLNGAHQDAVRAFHSRWYRPENVVVIVAGDIEPAESAALVKKWFSSWKGVGKPTPAPSFGDPIAPKDGDPANPVGETQVLVEPDLPRGISYAILRPWRPVNDTIVYNQGLMIDSLAQAVINRRLEAKARAGGSYLVAQVSQSDISRSVDGTFVAVTPLGADWQAALKEVRSVIADALATPPTQEEIDREVAEVEVAFTSPVEQRRLLPGSKVADDLVTALDIRETVAAPEAVLEIFQKSKPLFTPQAVLDHTRSLFKGTVTRAVLVTPKSGEGDAASLRQALAAPVAGDPSVRLANNKPIKFDEMPAIGEPGRITALAPTGLLNIEQVEFANGIKAMIWPTQDEPGRVAVKVRFGGGYRAFGANDAPYVTLGQMALVGSGEGTLGQEELDRISTGRKMGFDFNIEDAVFEFSADTRQQDLADQLYLFAAKFAMPRWDVNPVRRAKAAAQLQYETYATSPQGVLERDLKYLQRDRDPRFHTPSPAEIEKTTPEGFKDVWSRVLANGPIEVQIYGDFDRVATLAALQRTFGALKTRPPLPKDTAPASARQPAPTAQPVVLTHRGDDNQAAAVISWPTGGGSMGITESRQIEVLTQLFTIRLLDAMREKLGASYAPQVYSSWPLDLDSGGTITALAQLQPKDVPAFFTTAQEIAADLIARPVTADELGRVIEPMRQRVTRASTSAAFFMYQLEGATADPSRIGAIRTILRDYTVTTPEAMQALAAKYLHPDKSWKLSVLPQEATGQAPTPAAR
ncbi:M16 family metallopeptidase [Novosphingobium sp. JCM 18896]|uniref:M16 family metallopeptidase n=1 Tax=Novosphingobium sp. JCM 18896 TaxID=2989731 RepID=UPI002221709B|nr:M16 family metallopeptidase [Novosphingobium sp. JCM 18896]MCW1428024.1 insulinase family protein [Novosphingobium sp. JCM 18896]